MNARERVLLLCLDSLEPRSVADLIAATHWSRTATVSALWRLREQRLATRTGRATYRLTPKGQQLRRESPGPGAWPPDAIRHCRVCDCTQYDACWHEELGVCEWVEADLCSHCAAIAAGEIERIDVEQPADRAAFEEQPQ